jgi:hypothetical protein
MMKIWMFGLFSLAILAGCGADEAGYAKAAPFADSSGKETSALPPEEEVTNDKFLAVSPAFTEDYLFVANPSVDSISKISVRSPHPIDVITTGLYPSVIKGVGNRVAVLNSGDHSITFVTASTNKTFTLPINKDVNDIAFNPAGYGLGFVNTAKSNVINGGNRSVGEIAVINVAAGKVKANGVDFSPKHIVFSTDPNARPIALVAADAEGALFYLDDATKTSLVFSATLTASTLEEALIHPGGARAFFREAGRNGIRVLEINTKVVSTIAGDALPTDMDLVRPAAGNLYLYLSDRASGYRLRRFDANTAGVPLIDAVSSARQYSQTEFSPDGRRAVLFSTTSSEHFVGIFDAADNSIRDIDVGAVVSRVVIAPDSRTAVIIHNESISPQRLTLLNLETGESPPQTLAGDLHQIDFSKDGDFAFVTTKSPEFLIVYSLREGKSTYSEVALNDKPIFMSALPNATGGKAFVTQEHETGRITFVEVKSVESYLKLEAEVLTGFLLGTTTE